MALWVGWDAEPDTNRLYWRVYLSEDSDTKGELVTEMNPTETEYVIRDGVSEEIDYYVSIVPVGLGGTEGFWRGSGRVKYEQTKSFVVPSIPDAAVGGGGGGGRLKVWVRPVAKKDPPAKLQLIQGGDAATGKLVLEVPITSSEKVTDGDSQKAEMLDVTLLPGQRTGGAAVTYTVRPVNEAGHPGPVTTKVVQPLDEPNATAITIASIVGNVLTNFSGAATADGWEYDGANGLQLREIPAASAMTAGSGWGTYGSGGLLDSLKLGAHYVTSATVRSKIVDLGAVKTFSLEMYDEAGRETNISSVFDTRTMASLPYVYRPSAAEGWQDRSLGPEWVSRFVTGAGESILPVEQPEWQYRIGDTVAALTGSSWIEGIPMPRIRGRHVQVSIHPKELMGVHRWIAPKVYVRAWVEHAETTLAQKPHDGVLVPVGQAGIYFDNSSQAHILNITAAPIVGWDGKMTESDITANTSNGTLVVGTSGTYYVYCTANFTGSANTEMHGHLRIGGVEQFPGFHRKLSGGDVGSAAFGGHMSIAAGATLSLWMDSDADSKSATLVDASLGVFRIR